MWINYPPLQTIVDTDKHYAGQMFREALQTCWFGLQNARSPLPPPFLPLRLFRFFRICACLVFFSLCGFPLVSFLFFLVGTSTAPTAPARGRPCTAPCCGASLRCRPCCSARSARTSASTSGVVLPGLGGAHALSQTQSQAHGMIMSLCTRVYG